MSTGGSFPVKSLNCSAACPTNISSPLTVAAPAAAASFNSTVCRGGGGAERSEGDPSRAPSAGEEGGQKGVRGVLQQHRLQGRRRGRNE
eukprot:1192661-Prorocentrum_minimum.AAC.2